MKLILPYQNIFLLTAIFLFSCSDVAQKNKRAPVSIKDAYATQNNSEVARHFAETFQPDSFQYKGIGALGKVPDSVVYAFKALRQTDTLSYKRYLSVIFLKIYLDHLRCCHQSYELRTTSSFAPIDSIADPLLYELNLAGGFFDKSKAVEFFSSGYAEEFVIKNRHLLQFHDVKELVSKINPVEDSIQKHLYWK